MAGLPFFTELGWPWDSNYTTFVKDTPNPKVRNVRLYAILVRSGSTNYYQHKLMHNLLGCEIATFLPDDVEKAYIQLEVGIRSNENILVAVRILSSGDVKSIFLEIHSEGVRNQIVPFFILTSVNIQKIQAGFLIRRKSPFKT